MHFLVAHLLKLPYTVTATLCFSLHTAALMRRYVLTPGLPCRLPVCGCGLRWEGQKHLVEPFINDYVKFNSNTGWACSADGWCEVSWVLQLICASITKSSN